MWNCRKRREKKMVVDFKGKTALVTGGAGGIGAACVRELLNSNAKVAVADISQTALDTLRDELLEKGISPDKIGFYQMDITDVSAIGKTVTQIRGEMGEIEVLVQAAGLMKGQNGLDMTPEEWDLMFNINSRGLFFVMQQAVIQSMKQTGGSIVNFSSMAGIRGMRPGMASPHYSASKGAVAAMSKQAAVEWAQYGVRCNAVAPGGVLTEAMKNMEFPEETMDPIPLRRLSKPEEIANGVVFLASDKASMITGQILVIDGGSSAVGY